MMAGFLSHASTLWVLPFSLVLCRGLEGVHFNNTWLPTYAYLGKVYDGYIKSLVDLTNIPVAGPGVVNQQQKNTGFAFFL